MSEGLLDRLEKMEELLELKKGEEPPKRSFTDKLFGRKSTKKEFKVPLKARMGEKQKLKKNYALILWVNTNGYAHLDFAPIDNNFTYNKHSGLWHKVTSNYTLWYKKYPLLIIPEYSNIPYDAKKHSEGVEEEGLSSRHQKTLLEIAKQAESAGKKRIGGNWLWIGIVVIIILFLISELINGGAT